MSSATHRRAIVLLLGVLALGAYTYAPFFADLRQMGFQDWDVQSAYRAVTQISITRFHELPYLNPWLCGGFPAWGYAEGATNLVSPFAPLYFLFTTPVALRLESVLAFAIGVFATFLLAGRFTRSAALRALVAVVWMLTSRATLQISVGHTWHLAYAWMPLVLYFFDRALTEQTFRNAAIAGAVLALMVYLGGIYPVPHTALVMGVLALVRAASARSVRPLAALALAGAFSLGLAAPKLLPILDTLRDVPRLAESNEHLTIAQVLVMTLDRHQGFGDHPLLDLPANWAWWEWGIYIAWTGLACVVASPLGLRREPSRSAFVAGLLCALIAFGSFHPLAPWRLLHKAPLFSSQHVVSRFLYPALLLLLLAFVGGVARAVEWIEPRSLPFRVASAAVVLLLGVDLARVARAGTQAPFHLTPPAVMTWDPVFKQVERPAFNYTKPVVEQLRLRYRYDWPGRADYVAMSNNRGLVRCYGVPDGFHAAATGAGGRNYRGEAFVEGARGTATITHWTPNSADIQLTKASDALVVYDMNWDPNWTVDGAPALSVEGMVAGRAHHDGDTLHFRYRPRSLGRGLSVALIALAWFVTAVAGTHASARRRRF